MKTGSGTNIGMVGLGLVLSLTLAACGTVGGHHMKKPEMDHGSLLVKAPSTKALTVGPATLHAYTSVKGGSIYLAPAVTGGDGDCATAAADARPLIADRSAIFVVGAGQVACLSTTKRAFDLDWRTQRPNTNIDPVALQ